MECFCVKGRPARQLSCEAIAPVFRHRARRDWSCRQSPRWQPRRAVHRGRSRPGLRRRWCLHLPCRRPLLRCVPRRIVKRLHRPLRVDYRCGLRGRCPAWRDDDGLQLRSRSQRQSRPHHSFDLLFCLAAEVVPLCLVEQVLRKQTLTTLRPNVHAQVSSPPSGRWRNARACVA